LKRLVFIFLDTDKHASPFDMLMAIDLYPEAQILHYSNVEPQDAKKIVQDAMFPRGPAGAKYTKIFIGGYDVEKALQILEIAKKCMFKPFELSVIVDPRGAYTTASAAVAKTLALSIGRGLGGFAGKRVTVLAGTGPVGRTAAQLYAMEGAEVIVTSRRAERAEAVASKINDELGVEAVRGVEAASPTAVGEAIQESDIILSAGAVGVQLLPLNVLKEYGRRCRIIGDINAVPPPGVEGLKPTDDGAEILPGVWGVGALAIGAFKSRVEAELFKRAVESPKGVFDYQTAYEIAKSIALMEIQKG